MKPFYIPEWHYFQEKSQKDLGYNIKRNVQGGLCKFPFYNLEWEKDEVKGNECSKEVHTKLTVMRPNICLKGFSRLSNFVKKIKDCFVCSFNEMLLSFFEVNGHIYDMLHSVINQVSNIFISLDLLVCMQIPILEDVPQI